MARTPLIDIKVLPSGMAFIEEHGEPVKPMDILPAFGLVNVIKEGYDRIIVFRQHDGLLSSWASNLTCTQGALYVRGLVTHVGYASDQLHIVLEVLRV